MKWAGILDVVRCIACQGLSFARVVFLGMVLAVAVVPVGAEITEEGGRTVFRSVGNGGPLLTQSWGFKVPQRVLEPRLTFELGFATDETLVPQVFADAFTLTVQSADFAVSAVLLTADRSGFLWAPYSPGALEVSPASIQRTPLLFPALEPALDSSEAFRVDFMLPPELAGRDVVVSGDLFDNADGIRSMAYTAGLQVQSLPGGDLTNTVLESAAAVAGPYAVESEAVLDAGTRTFSLPLLAGSRFFRLESDLRLQMAAPRMAGGGVSLLYAVHPADLVVEEAEAVTGPFVPVQVAGFDVVEQAVVLSRPTGQRFYRMKSVTPLRLVALHPEENLMKLRFAAAPARLRVLSSAQPGGPYAVESGVSWDPDSRRLGLSESGVARFFRVRASEPRRITRIGIREGRWEVAFDGP